MSEYGFRDDELVLPPAGTTLGTGDEVHVRAVLHLIAVDEEDDIDADQTLSGESIRAYSRSLAEHLDGVAVAVDGLVARGWVASAPDGDPDEIAVAVLLDRTASAGELAADLGGLEEEAQQTAVDDLLLVFTDSLAEDDDEDAEATVPLRLEGGSLVVEEHEDEVELVIADGDEDTDSDVVELDGDGAGGRR